MKLPKFRVDNLEGELVSRSVGRRKSCPPPLRFPHTNTERGNFTKIRFSACFLYGGKKEAFFSFFSPLVPKLPTIEFLLFARNCPPHCPQIFAFERERAGNKKEGGKSKVLRERKGRRKGWMGSNPDFPPLLYLGGRREEGSVSWC